MSIHSLMKKGNKPHMKKGLAIGLGVAGGICLIGAVLGITFGLNAHVRDYVKNQVDMVVNDDALDLSKTKIENVIELTKAEKAEQGVQPNASEQATARFQFKIKELPSEIDASSVRLQCNIIKGDTKTAYFVAEVADTPVTQYEGITLQDDDEIALTHDLFKKDAKESYTIRTYWIAHPSVYLDTKVTFSYEKEEASASASSDASASVSAALINAPSITGVTFAA